MQKARKCHGELEYAISFCYRCKNNTNRIQEWGGSVDDLQCSRKLENAWLWLVSLMEVARKRLRCLPSPEITSNLDFDPTLFLGFCKFGSASTIDFQPLFWSAHDLYVLLNALGLNWLSKSSSIKALIFDLISFYNLPILAWFQSLCALMPWSEFGRMQAVYWNLYPTKNLWLSIFLILCDFIWFKMN